MDHMYHMSHRDNEDNKAYVYHRGNKDSKDHMDHIDCSGNRDNEDNKDHTDHRSNEDNKNHMNQTNHMNNTDYKETMKLDNQLCFPLYAAARSVTSLYTPLLKPLGLTYTQYIVFLVLWEKDEIPVGEICERLMLDNGTVSPLLKKMEKAGYITRSRSAEDDRVVVITLTEEGRKLQEDAKDIPEKVGKCIDLPLEKAQKLYELLYELLGEDRTLGGK